MGGCIDRRGWVQPLDTKDIYLPTEFSYVGSEIPDEIRGKRYSPNPPIYRCSATREITAIYMYMYETSEKIQRKKIYVSPISVMFF